MEPCHEVVTHDIEFNIDAGIKYDAVLSLNVNGKIIYWKMAILDQYINQANSNRSRF